MTDILSPFWKSSISILPTADSGMQCTCFSTCPLFKSLWVYSSFSYHNFFPCTNIPNIRVGDTQFLWFTDATTTVTQRLLRSILSLDVLDQMSAVSPIALVAFPVFDLRIAATLKMFLSSCEFDVVLVCITKHVKCLFYSRSNSRN